MLREGTAPTEVCVCVCVLTSIASIDHNVRSNVIPSHEMWGQYSDRDILLAFNNNTSDQLSDISSI